MRLKQQKAPSPSNSRNVFLLLTAGYLSATHGFVYQHPLSNQQGHAGLSAVQVDPRKAGRRRVVSGEETAATASQLDELLQRTPQDRNVLKEISGRIEVLRTTDEDVRDVSNDESQSKSEQPREETPTETTDEESAQERRKLAARAALLGSRKPRSKPRTSSSRTTSRTSTSVGNKRVGSASKARQGAGVTQRIMDAVRKSASSNKSKDDSDNTQNSNGEPSASAVSPVPLNRKLTPSGIHSAVLELMERQRKDAARDNTAAGSTSLTWNQPPQLLQPPISSNPPPGTVLIPASRELPNRRESKLQFPECLTVRVAHGVQAQDTEVAHLRLSVFSDFSPEVRRQLVSRSVNAVVTRRMKGATCLVATVPPSIAARKRNRPPVVLGSAECSFHEFEGTTLGRRRPADSILYITEVAVSPNARRRGIGCKLLEAIDVLAKTRGIESLYLHVDVENESAIALYENAGYRKVDASSDPMFLEFTTKLNLHDGATKGRNHYLLCKDMKNPTWLSDPAFQKERPVAAPGFHRPTTGALGFEVPC